jgi:hypothetical protein
MKIFAAFLFNLDNVEMIKCRYATEQQQQKKRSSEKHTKKAAERERKIIPYFD